MGKAIAIGVFVLGLVVGAAGIVTVLTRPAVSPSVANRPGVPPVQSEQTPPPSPVRPKVISTGPRSMWDAYAKNEVGADNVYLGKRVQLVGLVGEIMKDALNNIIVEIEAFDPPEVDRNDFRAALNAQKKGFIVAQFGDGWAKAIGGIERGQILGMECTGGGLHLGSPVLKNCDVTWTQPADLERFVQVLAPSYELCVVPTVGEKIFAVLDAGQMPDGGPLSQNIRDWPKLAAEVNEHDRDALARLGLKALPCEHPAMLLFGGCDGEKKDSAPQCKSELITKTWPYIYKGKKK